MRRAIGVLLVWSGLAVAGQPAFAELQTLQGEVIDPASYLKDGRHGPELEDQTYEAADGGQTLALLEEGTGSVYLLLAEQPGSDPNELVYEYVDRRVKITGMLYERGGLHGMIASAVTPLDPAAAAGPPSTMSASPPAPSPAVNED